MTDPVQLPRSIRMRTIAATDCIDTGFGDLLRAGGGAVVGLLDDATRDIAGFNESDDVVKKAILNLARVAIIKSVIEITTDEEPAKA